jgi:hypothetical protein
LKKRMNGVVPFDVLKREVESVHATFAPGHQAAASNVREEGLDQFEFTGAP